MGGRQVSPRREQRILSNPAPMLEYFDTLRGYMPTSPRAGGGGMGGGIASTLKESTSETLLARWQAKLAGHAELSWMLGSKAGEMNDNHMANIALEFRVSEKVKVETEEKVRDATVMYIGRVPEIGPGFWIGVEFEQPEGKHDGSLGGVQYFTCAAPHGSFLRPNRVVKIEVAVEAAPEPADDRIGASRRKGPALKLKGKSVEMVAAAKDKTTRKDSPKQSSREQSSRERRPTHESGVATPKPSAKSPPAKGSPTKKSGKKNAKLAKIEEGAAGRESSDVGS